MSVVLDQDSDLTFDFTHCKSIKLELFGKANIDFLVNTMCLDLIHIQKEIDKISIGDSSFFKALFTWMAENYDLYRQSNATNSILASTSAKRKLYNDYCEITQRYSVDSEFYIAHELCHVYGSFCMGGIEDAWLYSEKSEWYPKIIFKKRIASDIDTLDEEITIYRGTSQDEFDSKQFAQAWTLSKAIARSFAFTKYRYSSRLKNVKRVLLETKISRNDVLYYKKVTTAMEDEIIVNVANLIKVAVKESKCYKG